MKQKKVDFSEGADARTIVIDADAPVAGDVSAKLESAKPYTF